MKPTKESARRRLLKRYPDHLKLIDSGKIPSEHTTGPDLSYYIESAKFYYDLIVESSTHFKDKPQAVTKTDLKMAGLAYNRFVHATWGLIARGADSVPYAIQLVRSSDRDHREAAANVLGGLRTPERLPEILQSVHLALQNEPDQEVLDSLLGVLGELRSQDSIPVLSRFLIDDSVDSDTRGIAAYSLGQIVRKRFNKTDNDPIQVACDWLKANGYGPQ
jgi:hypothetical protein